MNDQKNTILFIALSAIILIGWSILFPPTQRPAMKKNCCCRRKPSRVIRFA